MKSLDSKPIFTFIMAYALMSFTTAAAYDASLSDFQWNDPQILTPETRSVQYSFRFQLSPSAYPSNCHYYTQLYLSRDRMWSTDDFALLGPIDTLLPAGAVGFSATVTRPLEAGFSLPASGTYYVFVRLTPGTGAPPDTNSTNNAAIAANSIQVQVVVPQTTRLTAATVVTVPRTGRTLLVAGYNDGVLEFRDWQGNILSTRSGFGQVTAVATGIVGSPPQPRLFVASTDTGGSLRAIDLTNISRNIVSLSNFGTVTAVEVCNGTDGAVYIATSDMGGTLRKLNILTLAEQTQRRSMGAISKIEQMRGTWGDILVVGSDISGGSVYFVDRGTLVDVLTRRQNLGHIYALSSGDMDRDGEAELVIASDSSGGTIRLREGPNFSTNLAMRSNLGEIYALDYGPMGMESVSEPAGSAWLFYGAGSRGGSLNVIHVTIASNAMFQDWSNLRDLGPVRYVELHDFYTVDTPFVGAVWEGAAGPSLYVMDESLTETGTAPASTEGFESGDFNRFAWQRSGDASWIVTSQQKHSGLFSARAGTVSHNQSTTLQVRLACTSGNITFYRKVSSETGFDFLKFYIDGVQKDRWSGEMDWSAVSFPVTTGTRTFTWTYVKDNSVSQGSDTAWIDDIVFPISSSTGVSLSFVGDEDSSLLEQEEPLQIEIQYEQ